MKWIVLLGALLLPTIAYSATFAELNKDNSVLRVIVITDDNAKTEEDGVNFLKKLYGSDTVWKQTDTETKIRKNYAGIGFIYDTKLDAFVPPKPNYPDAVLNEQTAKWNSQIETAEIEASKEP